MSSMKSWGLFLVKGKLSPHIVNVVGAIKFFFFLLMVIIEGVRYLLEPCIV